MNSDLSYYAYNYQGKVEEGFATSLKALEIAEISGDILLPGRGVCLPWDLVFLQGLFYGGRRASAQRNRPV